MLQICKEMVKKNPSTIPTLFLQYKLKLTCTLFVPRLFLNYSSGERKSRGRVEEKKFRTLDLINQSQYQVDSSNNIKITYVASLYEALKINSLREITYEYFFLEQLMLPIQKIHKKDYALVKRRLKNPNRENCQINRINSRFFFDCCIDFYDCRCDSESSNK
ncbi:hypothetical protein BpHYR1_024390 [Brachionus plicatilis]|uniref:Uncharacterized protein n=1 Tax=Brachionus plicatilis TaxID=10195 RepID=A0A3M7QSR0_BRAPC|nr:hypothetical protein BpHYR1_024390 [Brachionus plicatilis]